MIVDAPLVEFDFDVDDIEEGSEVINGSSIN